MKFYSNEKSLLVGLLGKNTTLTEVVADTVEASFEKHIPVVELEGNNVKVTVGSVIHPMIDVHYIEVIAVETKKGFQIKYLNPGELPIAEFTLVNDEFVSAYAYCNLHGLWRSAN